jgi:hypothetical protein
MSEEALRFAEVDKHVGRIDIDAAASFAAA